MSKLSREELENRVVKLEEKVAELEAETPEQTNVNKVREELNKIAKEAELSAGIGEGKEDEIYPTDLTIEHEIKAEHGMCHSRKGVKVGISINSNDYHHLDVRRAVRKAVEGALVKYY